MNAPRPADDVLTTEFDGERALIFAPVIAEDYPAAAREGLGRRRLVTAGGTCPCGARMRLPNRAARRAAIRAGEILRVRVEHEDDCPATNENLDRAMRGAA